MDIHNLGSILTAVLSIAVVVTGGLLGLQIGTVRTLRDSNGDLRQRVTDLENGRTADHAEIATLKADRDALGRVVTGETHWVALGQQLDEHHTEARTHWQKDETILEQILQHIRDALKEEPRDRG